jgi:hypothetical protein
MCYLNFAEKYKLESNLGCASLTKMSATEDNAANSHTAESKIRRIR